jgi:uncharacterized protein (DUF305 family)
MSTIPLPRTSGALLALVLAACGTPGASQGGAQPAPEHAGHAAAATAPAAARGAPNAADVRFMAGMITHHAQAVEMTALVPARAARADVRLLAERIAVSQEDETSLMRRWLRSRGAPEPDPHAHHAGDHARMPGMATGDEMARLAAASGAAFDALFLELMIRHHEGALTMVSELFGTPGGGQDTDVFEFASHVDADQRMEIARMRTMQQR